MSTPTPIDRDELETELGIIAMFQAQYLHKISQGNTNAAVLQRPAIVKARKLALASSLARETKRSFEEVMQEVELGFMVQLRRILARDAKDDPVLKGLKTIVVVDGDGEVCGICLEEMKQGCETKAMDCMHRFHPSCIFQWLSRKKNTCPLCRHQMQIH
ncbi:zinc finger protein, putative [Ricinus communis]|uniref:RING-type E3 ubiquitin transferase n=1 Tax=Ricinus communis TaxID=3988 RepID=B9SM31_RICCO|nr:zinc finger protein, putative [Ricinus communis]|eukprot:XP_002527050.1 E3 ubiquitin-protein ligase RNF167 [Ricinus communis]